MRKAPCKHGITSMRCAICDGPDLGPPLDADEPAAPVTHPDDPRAKLREPADPEAPGISALPGVDEQRDGEWLGINRKIDREADDATNATAAERFRREYIGTWASTEPPPMRMCQRLHVPSAVLIHGDRGSGRTHTLLDLMGERLRHTKVVGDVRPFLFVCTNDRLRRHLRAAAVQRDIDMRHIMTPAELEVGGAHGYDGLLVDGWADLTDRERSFLLAIGQIRYFTL